MSRTNIDIDEEACAEIMRRYQLNTKKDAVNFALRTVAAEPLSMDEANQSVAETGIWNQCAALKPDDHDRYVRMNENDSVIGRNVYPKEHP